MNLKYVKGITQVKIEHFYYDEQEKWLAQMKAAMEKHDAKLSEEELKSNNG